MNEVEEVLINSMLCTLETQQSSSSGGVGDKGAGAASATDSEGMYEFSVLSNANNITFK